MDRPSGIINRNAASYDTKQCTLDAVTHHWQVVPEWLLAVIQFFSQQCLWFGYERTIM